jgi:hypothetical protein
MNEKSQRLLAFPWACQSWQAVSWHEADSRSGFLGVCSAPAVGRYLLASEQGATTGCVASFSLEQGACTALLAGGVFGVLDFGGVRGITQGGSLGVLFIHQGLGHGLGCCQSGAAQSDLHHENATVGLFHKNSSKVGNNFNGRILTSKKLERCGQVLQDDLIA